MNNEAATGADTATVPTAHGGPSIHAVHLTSMHHALDTRILHKECKTLADAGHRVTLIARHPRAETVDGVRIVPIDSVNRRWQRMTRVAPDVFRKAMAADGDIYHFHDPELIPVGLALKAAGKRVIYDTHEDTPLVVLMRPWLAPWLRRFVSWGTAATERLASLLFDGIVVTTPTVARRFPKRKTALIRNYPIHGEIDAESGTPYAERPPHVAYVGSITEERGAWVMVDALGQLDDYDPTRLVLVGAVAPTSLLATLREHPAWPRVIAKGWQERAGVVRELAEVRAGLVTLLPTRAYREILPVKLFEYMLAGIPVIASDFPSWRSIVDEAECGLLVDPLDTAQVADAIRWVIDHPAEAEVMGRRGRDAALRQYSWQREGERLVAFYSGLLR